MDDYEMRTSMTQYRIADFVQWHRSGQLVLNPDFQRRSIWTLDAKSYLIDTILLGFPIPKIYLRATADPKTQVTVRDVVDGQQRLRAILDFADNLFALNKRSERYRGLRYNTLDPVLQQAFLTYQVGVESFNDPADAVVLQAFSRLNSYTLPLNAAEKRHARYQTELKWFVHELANDLRDFLTNNSIISTRTMLRMGDDDFFAEVVNLAINGVVDGGADALTKLYTKLKGEIPNGDRLREQIHESINWLDTELSPILDGSALSRSYQVLMLFAAYMHQRYGLPPGAIEYMPASTGVADRDTIIDRLSVLAEALESEDDLEANPYADFVRASSGATTRMSSRGPRFLAFSDAFARR